MVTDLLVSASEAAFLAALSDQQMNRVVDEQLMPGELFEAHGTVRRFTRLSAAFAKFYFDDHSWLLSSARRNVLNELTARIRQLPGKDDVFALLSLPERFNWKVADFSVEVDMAPYIAEVSIKVKDVFQADALVSADPQVMGGAAVFAGTRVPLGMVLGSLDSGIDMQSIQEAYPFLTLAHVQAARVYEKLHPNHTQTKPLSTLFPESMLSFRQIVRPAAA